jgi:hypothetical protein
MKLSLLIERTHEEKEYEIELECDVDFDPGYAPSSTQDHDNPGFGDPGDPGFLEVRKAVVERCACTDDEVTEVWLKKGDEYKEPLTDRELDELRELAEGETADSFDSGYDDDI